jgi:hypothetical protein
MSAKKVIFYELVPLPHIEEDILTILDTMIILKGQCHKIVAKMSP